LHGHTANRCQAIVNALTASSSSAPLRLVDRPVPMKSTFQLIDNGGALRKRKFSSVGRNGFFDDPLAVFKAIHKRELLKSTEPTPPLPADMGAIKRDQRRGPRH
jgi:hypothetical protein